MRAWTIIKKPMYTSLSLSLHKMEKQHGTYKHGHKFLFLFVLCTYQNSDQTIQFGGFMPSQPGRLY